MHSLLGGPRWEGDYVDIATGPVTELDAPRPGPVRRFFAGRPAAMDAVVIVALVAGVAVSTVDPLQSRSVIAAVVIAAVGAAALAFRRSHPLPVAGAMGALAVGAVAVTGQLAGVELGVGFALHAVAIAHTTPTAWLTAAVTTAASLLAVWLWEEPTVDPVATGRSGALVLTDDRWASSAGVLVMAPAGL